MAGLKVRAMEHSSRGVPATTNGIEFKGEQSTDNTMGTLNTDPAIIWAINVYVWFYFRKAYCGIKVCV